MWFKDFSATQILGKINLDDFEATKSAILTTFATLNFEVLGNFDI